MPQEYADHIELGDHVRDPITGFEGTVTARTIFLHGCQRCCVTAHTLDKEGKEYGAHFDEAQLVVVEAAKHAPKLRNTVAPPGGPSRTADSSERPTGTPPRS